MNTVSEWLSVNWSNVVIPLAVFMAAIIATLWLRTYGYRVLKRWASNTKWPADKILVDSIKTPSILWCLFISISLAIAVSVIPSSWKNPINNGLWTLLLASITIYLLNITNSFLRIFVTRFAFSETAVTMMRSIIRIVILVIAALMFLAIWGVPTTPLLLLVVVIILAGALALRDFFPNLAAGLQINAAGQIKIGDYVKIETGEEGYITQIDWRTTHLRTLDESSIIIPNSRFVRSTVINYGKPLKKADKPFRFYTRFLLTELTGLKASSLHELADILRTAPDAVVYYHTHHFLEQYHYLTPEPSNDFALWVEALGDEALAEKLASVDTFLFSNLSSLRDRLVGILDEYLTQTSSDRYTVPGREFYFMKSRVMIGPTRYVAHDLREFVEALRQISLGSIYFHIFESRLRLGTGLNDFTTWLKNNLGEEKLGEEIGKLDPYTYTLEGLRSLLIQIIEKRIK
jgi:hypothetical protein